MSIFELRHASKHVSLSMVAGFLLAPATLQAAQVPAVNAGITVKQAVKLDEIATLRSAAKLLEEANHDYNGHRSKAVHAIHAALRELQHRGKKGTGQHAPTNPAAAAAKASVRASVTKGNGIPNAHEAQAVSDTQLRAAQQLLLKAQAELTTGKHLKALAHVQIAIQELEVALKIL